MLTLANKLSLDSPETVVQWSKTAGEIEKVSFCTKPFGKDTFFDKDTMRTVDIYGLFNLYLATLTIAEQKTIFDAYNNIHYSLQNTISNKELVSELRQAITTISHLIDVDRIYNWVKSYSNIFIPEGFEDTYLHDINNNKSLEKTYLRDDYVYLVSYCIALKAYVPVWGEYINLIRKEIGTDFKEYNSFQLLSGTNYISTKPYQKLLIYINSIKDNDIFNSYNVINNISSEDYTYYIFCLTNVRKLPFIEIKQIGEAGADSKLNIITYVYKYIKQRIKGNNNPKNIVKSKDTTSATIDENSKISVLERYKIKTNISLEDIVELEFSVSNIDERSLYRLTSEIDPNVLADAIRTSAVLYQSAIPETSVRLLQWVFKPIISPRGIMYLSKPVLVRLLGILQAVLWARGFKDLALLSTARRELSDGAINVFSMDDKSKIPKELLDELDRLYPFNTPIRGNRQAKNETRYIVNTITDFTNHLTGVMLKMTANDQFLQEVYGNTNRRYTVKPDIKIALAKLLIQIGRRDWI